MIHDIPGGTMKRTDYASECDRKVAAKLATEFGGMSTTGIVTDCLRELAWIRGCNGYAESEPEHWLEARLFRIEHALRELGAR